MILPQHEVALSGISNPNPRPKRCCRHQGRTLRIPVRQDTCRTVGADAGG